MYHKIKQEKGNTSVRGHRRRATEWLNALAKKEPKLFAHWVLVMLPT